MKKCVLGLVGDVAIAFPDGTTAAGGGGGYCCYCPYVPNVIEWVSHLLVLRLLLVCLFVWLDGFGCFFLSCSSRDDRPMNEGTLANTDPRSTHCTLVDQQGCAVYYAYNNNNRIYSLSLSLSLFVCLCVCMCVCLPNDPMSANKRLD